MLHSGTSMQALVLIHQSQMQHPELQPNHKTKYFCMIRNTGEIYKKAWASLMVTRKCTNNESRPVSCVTLCSVPVIRSVRNTRSKLIRTSFDERPCTCRSCPSGSAKLKLLLIILLTNATSINCRRKWTHPKHIARDNLGTRQNEIASKCNLDSGAVLVPCQHPKINASIS